MFANGAQCGAMRARRGADSLVGCLAVTLVRRRELRDRDSQGHGRILPLYVRNRTSFPDRKMPHQQTGCRIDLPHSKLRIVAHLATDNCFPNGPMTSTFAPPIAVAELERDARMKRLHRLLAALSILYLVTLGLAAAARAYDAAPVSDPEALGFSPSRLARIAAWQQSQVDAGAFSGAVAAIARN